MLRRLFALLSLLSWLGCVSAPRQSRPVCRELPGVICRAEKPLVRCWEHKLAHDCYSALGVENSVQLWMYR